MERKLTSTDFENPRIRYSQTTPEVAQLLIPFIKQAIQTHLPTTPLSEVRLVELGIGAGTLLRETTRAGFGSVFGIDAIIRQEARDLPVVQAILGEGQVLTDRSINVVYSNLCFQPLVYPTNVNQAMCEIAAMLAPGGIYIGQEGARPGIIQELGRQGIYKVGEIVSCSPIYQKGA